LITLKVTPDGGDEYTVTATSRDVFVWEKANRNRTFGALMQDMAMVDLYKLAHIASRREGLYTGSLSEFTEQCEIAQGDEEDDAEPDPTRRARSTDG
jgi:hypothetical protein